MKNIILIMNKKTHLILLLLIFNFLLINVEAKKEIDYSDFINQINENINITNLVNTTAKLCENNSRITGTINCNYSALYIKKMLENQNMTQVYFESFPYNNTKTLNVIGQLKNVTTYNSNILIMAHYDSISEDGPAPGANDNAASFAGILEIVRILQIILNDTLIYRNLIVLSTSGEEEGLYGSRYWIMNNPEILSTLISVINFDMIGWGDYHTIIGDENSQWLSNFIIECSKLISVEISKSHAIYPSTIKSDHANFMNINIPTVWIFERDEYYPYMHTSLDTPDRINYLTVANCVRLFTLVIYRMMTESDETSNSIITIGIIIIIGVMIPILIYIMKINKIYYKK